ncbi:hypothetical protein SEA_CAMERICO_69 [Gordonia phage Camerico]|nr:hypothetical protein SEA_CAMERICO_69 [Gordonia phage Camerico]
MKKVITEIKPEVDSASLRTTLDTMESMGQKDTEVYGVLQKKYYEAKDAENKYSEVTRHYTDLFRYVTEFCVDHHRDMHYNAMSHGRELVKLLGELGWTPPEELVALKVENDPAEVRANKSAEQLMSMFPQPSSQTDNNTEAGTDN